jgi:hypothetical protein
MDTKASRGNPWSTRHNCSLSGALPYKLSFGSRVHALIMLDISDDLTRRKCSDLAPSQIRILPAHSHAKEKISAGNLQVATRSTIRFALRSLLLEWRPTKGILGVIGYFFYLCKWKKRKCQRGIGIPFFVYRAAREVLGSLRRRSEAISVRFEHSGILQRGI